MSDVDIVLQYLSQRHKELLGKKLQKMLAKIHIIVLILW
jgi:hypothetical protein